MFVDGAWTGSLSGETFTADSPATGEAIGEVPHGNREDAQLAIDAANRATAAWSRLTAFERAATLHRVGDAIEHRRGELAHTLTLDQGKPLRESRDEVEELIAYWRNAAEDGKRLEGRLANSMTPGKRVLLVRRARGVIGVITPWNWPYTMPAELIAPALASGNTVVWTPASTTAVAAVALAQCIVEADLPQGVFNLVTGPGSTVGDEIARNPGTHGIGFIGSTETGRKVAEAAAGKALVLELGGNGPVVVLDDADLELAAEAAVTACFLCAGQSCTAGERLLVHRAARDEFVERLLVLVAERVVLGDPFADSTTMGPLNNAGVADKMDEHVADARQRRRPRRRIPDEPLLAADRARRRARRCARSAGGDLRPGRAGGRDRLARRRHPPHQRIALRSPVRDLHARPRAGPPLRRRGARRLGERQRQLELLGATPAVRRACRHVERDRPSRRQRADGVVHRAPDRRSLVTYDVVIVGGGSAGCVLAARLTEDASTRVLVLEAGRKDASWDLFVHMPAALSFPIGNRFYDWKYESEPEPHLNGRQIYHARGKLLGGSSSINGMIFQRGNPLDYERWELPEWDYAHVLPYFKRMESCDAGADDWRGGDGPLLLERGPARGSLYAAFFEAVQQAGYPLADDVNGYRQEGFARFDRNISRGRRWSAARAYLHPARPRPNLEVRTRTYVERVVFEGSRAVGVRVAGETIRADEVILCGGAINSPQLLQLSGVGNAAELEALGIDVVHDAPGVGENLQDHLEVYVQCSSKLPVTLAPAYKWRNRPGVGLRWLLSKSGPGASNHFEAGGFIRSNDVVAYPNTMFHFLPIAVRYDGTAAKGHGYQLHVGPMYSDARGSVKLRSADPRVHPALRFNYLSTDQDRREWVECVHAARSILSQRAFDAFDGGELSPGSEVETDEQILAWVARDAETALHPSCTTRMGTDALSVVDPSALRVHGVDGLRVVDAGVLPYVPNGNIYAPTMMVAEKAADLIRGNTPLAPEPVDFYRHDGVRVAGR